MAPPTKTAKTVRVSKNVGVFKAAYQKYISFDYIKYLLFDPTAYSVITVLILLGELLLNLFVIWRVPYTEIDWIAYMQECEGFVNGTTNYAQLRGDTGPLVYPAAFVYIYTALYYITSHGKNVRLAQYIFMCIYMLQMWLVLRLYAKSRKVPPYVLIFSAFTSYRVHSIYVLRLFNDPVAILFAYVALNLFIDRHFTLGSILFSLGVGVKMNILLFAPALLIFYLTNLGLLQTILQLAACGFVQLFLGAPFLLTYPLQYIKGSFDLGRIFEHKWTVNYRFLSRELFELRTFHWGLLLMHLLLLVTFAAPSFVFCRSYANLRALQQQLQPQLDRRNLELKKPKTLKKQKPKKEKNETKNEQLTKAQQQFLNSFEKSLQNATGKKAPNPPAAQQKPTAEHSTEKVEQTVGIHFDQCTQLALLPFFISNFIGIVCARSLHYQFYVWYYHSLPYLVFSTHFNVRWRLLILGLLELCWNTYPSTNWSSGLLHVCHLLLLGGLFHYCYGTLINLNNLRMAQENKPKEK